VSLGGTTNVQGLAWRFGFVGAMLVNLKQANPVLLALVTVGLILVALGDPAIRTRRVLALLPRMLGPAIFLFALWRWYVSQNSPHSEQAFRPFDTWNFGVLRQTFAAIGGIIADTPLFHSMMWLVTVAGLAVFFRLPEKASEARWLAVVCATVWLGYNVFLLIRLSRRHESHRCSNGSRLLALYATRGATRTVLAGHGAGDRTLADMDEPAEWFCYGCDRAAGSLRHASSQRSQQSGRQGMATLPPRRRDRHAARDTPPAAKVLIVPVDNGSPFAVAVRYNLWQLGMPGRQIFATILWEADELARVATWAARGEENYLLIQDAEGVMDEVTDLLGLPRINHELVLFGWQDGAWQRVKSWPVPPDLDGLSCRCPGSTSLPHA
jgi:hypothetical protein